MISVAVAAWGILAALHDVRRRRIANWLTLPAIMIGVGWLVWARVGTAPADPAELASMGVLIALALSMPGYALGKMGGGDVKYLTAIALWTGATGVVLAILSAALGAVIWHLASIRARTSPARVIPFAAVALPGVLLWCGVS